MRDFDGIQDPPIGVIGDYLIFMDPLAFGRIVRFKFSPTHYVQACSIESYYYKIVWKSSNRVKFTMAKKALKNIWSWKINIRDLCYGPRSMRLFSKIQKSDNETFTTPTTTSYPTTTTTSNEANKQLKDDFKESMALVRGAWKVPVRSNSLENREDDDNLYDPQSASFDSQVYSLRSLLESDAKIGQRFMLRKDSADTVKIIQYFLDNRNKSSDNKNI